MDGRSRAPSSSWLTIVPARVSACATGTDCGVGRVEYGSTDSNDSRTLVRRSSAIAVFTDCYIRIAEELDPVSCAMREAVRVTCWVQQVSRAHAVGRSCFWLLQQRPKWSLERQPAQAVRYTFLTETPMRLCVVTHCCPDGIGRLLMPPGVQRVQAKYSHTSAATAAQHMQLLSSRPEPGARSVCIR